MADYGFNLNLSPQTKPTSLGEMLNLASGAQQLQQAQQINPLQLQEAQQRVQAGNITLGKSRQEEQERLALQEFMSNPENYQTNGRIDINKLNSSIPKIAPLTGHKHISELTTLGEAQTKGIEAKNKLSTTQRAIIAGPVAMLGRMGINDPKVYIQELNHLKEMHKDQKDINDLIDVEIGLLSKSKEGPHISQGAIRSAQALLSPAEQEAKFAPSIQTVNTNSEIKPVVVTPSVAGSTPNIKVGGGEAIPTTIGPGQRVVPTGRVDMNNNPTAIVYNPDGTAVGEITIPAVGGQQAAPTQPSSATTTQPIQTAPAPARMRPGETAETLKEANAIRTRASDSAKILPNEIFNNTKIIEYADKAKTGKGAQTLANLTGGYAGFNGQIATDLNQLGHYMALQTASLAQAAGLGTDTGRSIAGQMSGVTDWTPDAIRNTARVNRALATAGNLFNLGVENSFQKTNDPFSARDFQNKWSQVADIEAIQLYDAIKNGSKADVKYVVDSMGGPNSDKYKKALQKINFMNTVLKGQ